MSSDGRRPPGHVEQLLAVRALVADQGVSKGGERLLGGRSEDRPELGDVLHRRGPEPLEVPKHERSHRGRDITRTRLIPGADVRRPRPERPWRARRRVDERADLAERPPEIGLRRTEPRLEPALHVGVDPGHGGEGQQVRQERLRVRDGDALPREPSVVEPSRPQRRLHRLVEGRVVIGGDRVERDAHELRLDHRLVGEGGVEVARIEAGDPIPERDVRRSGFLRLHGDDPADRLHDIDRLAPQQQLAGEGRTVELTCGEPHPGSVAGGSCLNSASPARPYGSGEVGEDDDRRLPGSTGRSRLGQTRSFVTSTSASVATALATINASGIGRSVQHGSARALRATAYVTSTERRSPKLAQEALGCRDRRRPAPGTAQRAARGDRHRGQGHRIASRRGEGIKELASQIARGLGAHHVGKDHGRVDQLCPGPAGSPPRARRERQPPRSQGACSAAR